MGINKERALGQLGPLRQLANSIPLLEHFPSIIGLGDGLLRRELIMAGLHHVEIEQIPVSPQKSEWEDILTLAKTLPQPFWIGLHPQIAQQLHGMLHRPEDAYWQTPLRRTPIRFDSPAVIPTEPGIDMTESMRQVDFVNQHLPKNSIRTYFLTNGQNSIWKHVPGAGIFADNPHQMSLPARAMKKVGGFNLLLLTQSESVTMPNEWRSHPELTTLQMMNLHQVGHCLIIPTCWEYLDRTYSLLTPSELLTLTSTRAKASAQWFANYGLGVQITDTLDQTAEYTYSPDSTSYLYEIKIVERALIYAAQRQTTDVFELPNDLYWFQGLHLEQICAELGVKREKVLGAICALNELWLTHHSSKPTDPLFNSVFQSTDIGTHPAEEICVDVLAQAAIGKLPKQLEYWQSWVDQIEAIWQRFDPTFRMKGSSHSLPLAGASGVN